MQEKSLALQFYEAITEERRDALVALLEANPDELNAHTFMGGQTWLGYASQIGKLGSIKALCDMGADVNVGDSHYGSKPICSAADNGHTDAVAFLLSREVSLDVDASVRNPLFAAIVGRSAATAQLLLEAGIDATVRYNSPTMKDMDAVAFALMRGEREIAELVASWNAGGDPDKMREALERADQVADENAGVRRPRSK
jgi:ankyrin repeat protein